jgi:hypothetical protein
VSANMSGKSRGEQHRRIDPLCFGIRLGLVENRRNALGPTSKVELLRCRSTWRILPAEMW